MDIPKLCINGQHYRVVETQEGLWKLEEVNHPVNWYANIHVTGPVFDGPATETHSFDATYSYSEGDFWCKIRIKDNESDEELEQLETQAKFDELEESGFFTPRMFGYYYFPVLKKAMGILVVGDAPEGGIDLWTCRYAQFRNCFIKGRFQPIEKYEHKNYGKKHAYTKRDLAMVLRAPGKVIAFVSQRNPLAKGSGTFWNVMRHIIVVDPVVEQEYSIEDAKRYMEETRKSGNTFSTLPPKLASLAEDVYQHIAV